MSETVFSVYDGRNRLLSECPSIGSVLLACWTHLNDDGEQEPLTIRTPDDLPVGQAFESFGSICIHLRREAVRDGETE